MATTWLSSPRKAYFGGIVAGNGWLTLSPTHLICNSQILSHDSILVLPDSPAKVFQVRFWMMHWGAKSSKRTIFSGNIVSMTCLDKGTLKASEKKKKQKATTTRIFHACLGWFWDRIDLYNSFKMFQVGWDHSSGNLQLRQVCRQARS